MGRGDLKGYSDLVALLAKDDGADEYQSQA